MEMNYINLDFCIIENPIDSAKKPIIFVTRKGMVQLDETVINEDDYEKAAAIIQDMGYVEFDILTFEFSQDPDFTNIEIDEIKKILQSKGMSYSEEFEKAMKSEFLLLTTTGVDRFLIGTEIDDSEFYNETKKKHFIKYKNKYKIPEIGEKLTLYFYLFVECRFSGEKCYMNLNGDFISKDSDDLRNFVIPFKCNFVRINNAYNPNKIILKSCLTNKKILKELPINFFGSFNLKIKEIEAVINKVFVYYLMEVKNSFPQENRITIEIDSLGNFDQMIKMSKKIKQNYIINKKRDCQIVNLSQDFNKMKEILIPKMFSLADKDEFEKASKIKKDINHIDEMNKLLSEKFQEKTVVPYGEFIKNFHLN